MVITNDKAENVVTLGCGCFSFVFVATFALGFLYLLFAAATWLMSH